VEWLYERTLSGKTVILPVVHGFDKDDIPLLVKELGWKVGPRRHLEYLFEISDDATKQGISWLGDKLAERIRRWHD